MLNVGLTGNLASGKSTVLGWFAQWGATAIDADQLVREVQRPGSPVLEEIRRCFGDGVILPGGELDRAALRKVVFRDPAARQALNAIVHPAVRERRRLLLEEAEARGDLVVVSDIPLLFETLDPASFDLIVLVDAPAELRRKRLITQRGIEPEEADRMLAAQLPPEAKRERSHIVLDNRGSLDDLRTAAWEAWREIRKRAARKALGAPGKLLAVTADPGDAACRLAGTLARYRDAGVELCLAAMASEKEAPAAASIAREIGIARQHSIADPRALSRLFADYRPAVTVSHDPSSSNPRRAAAGSAAREAWYAAGRPGRLFYAVEPKEERVAAILDVRPWRDVQGRALEEARVSGCGEEGGMQRSEGRECYLAEGEFYEPLNDLFSGLGEAA